MVLGHVKQYLSSNYFDRNIFDDARDLPYNRGLELWYSRLNEMEVTALLVHEAYVWGEVCMPSIAPHPDNRMGCFRTISFATREVTGYSYEPLASDLGLRLQDNSTYSDGGDVSFKNMTFKPTLFA